MYLHRIKQVGPSLAALKRLQREEERELRIAEVIGGHVVAWRERVIELGLCKVA